MRWCKRDIMYTFMLSGTGWFGEFMFFDIGVFVVGLFGVLSCWLPMMMLLVVKTAMPGRSVY